MQLLIEIPDVNFANDDPQFIKSLMIIYAMKKGFMPEFAEGIIAYA